MKKYTLSECGYEEKGARFLGRKGLDALFFMGCFAGGGISLCYSHRELFSMPSSSFWPQWNDQPVFTVLLVLLLASGALFGVASAVKAFREFHSVGYAEQMSPSISVTGEGKAVIQNTLAMVDVGVTKTAVNASDAQRLATESMNALTAALQSLGIVETDLQTSAYSVYPQYDYEAVPAKIVGYEARQTLTVKIRETDLVNAVLGKAGEMGATDIGSLRFEVDDDTAAVREARTLAITRAREQAEATARALGARLGDVVSYSENTGDMGYAPVYAEGSFDGARGGDYVPDIQLGESEVLVHVYLTYALE